MSAKRESLWLVGQTSMNSVSSDRNYCGALPIPSTQCKKGGRGDSTCVRFALNFFCQVVEKHNPTAIIDIPTVFNNKKTTEYYVMNDFYKSIIQVEFPKIKLKFKDDSILQKLFQIINFNYKNTISCSKNSIWFPSRKSFNGVSNETINEILAHEYVHLVQRRNNQLHNLLGSLPESIGLALLLIACIIGISEFGLLFWFCGVIGFLLTLPVAPIYRLESEFEAYRMSILVRIVQWNGKFKLPKSHYDLFQVSDAMLRDMLDGLFSKTYNAQWSPAWLKIRYFERMKKWRDECMLNYFVERLAFDNKNVYIDSDANIYFRILRYFIAHSEYVKNPT